MKLNTMDLFKRNCIAPAGLCGFGVMVFSTNVSPLRGSLPEGFYVVAAANVAPLRGFVDG